MKFSLPLSLLLAFVFHLGSAAAPAQDAFVERVEATAKAMKWKIELDADKRWMLVSGATKESTERVVRGLKYAHEMLDHILGPGPSNEQVGWVRPAILFYVPQKKSRPAVIDAIAPADEPANEEWRDWARRQDMFCYAQQGYSFQKQSAGPDNYGRYLVTAAVHTEFARRFGAYPYWAAEGVNMAIQQKAGRWVGSFLSIDAGRTDMNKLAKSWPQRAEQACQQDLFGNLEQVAAEAPRPDDFAPWFAIGYWAAEEAKAELYAYLSLYGRKATPGQGIDPDYHALLVKACFGPLPQQRVAKFWQGGAKVAGTKSDMAAAAAKELAEFGGRVGMKEVRSKDGTWQVWVEASVADRDWISAFDQQSEWLAAILPEVEANLPAVAFVAEDRDSFRAVCDVSAEAAPVNAKYLRSARESSGFSSGSPPIVGVWLQDFGDGYDQAYDLSRQMMLVKLMQHCGSLPWGLLKGISTSVQRLANGEVRAHYFGAGATFIAADVWDSAAARLIAAGRLSIEEHLHAPIAAEFDRDRELLCYAFAKFMLDARPKQSKKFLKDYRTRLNKEGSAAMTAHAVEDLIVKHFGKKWQADLQKYWSL